LEKVVMESMTTRKYPENRDPEKRKASRRAYHHRNKERINAELRKKRGNVKDWWADVCERIEKIASKEKIT